MKKAMQHKKEVNLYQLTSLEIQELKSQTGFSCPYCHEATILKMGPRRQAHFAHVSNCQYEPYENESPEHIHAKNLLAGWLKSQGIASQIEKPFPKIGRIADLAFDYKGEAFVFEIQKSAISEELYNARTKAYEQAGIRVIWVFIGKLVKKRHSYILNSVMALNQKLPLIHLEMEREMMSVFSNVVWVNSREIQAQVGKTRLKTLTLETLLKENDSDPVVCPDGWLASKHEFRVHKWLKYMQHDRPLRMQCQRLRTNLSLLPAEVGWPVSGGGFRKNVMVWQAYVLLSITEYAIGEPFTLSQIANKLKYLHQLSLNTDCLSQLKEYLHILARLGILDLESGYYLYAKAPKFFKSLENALQEDERLALKVLSPA
ncbi:MAG: competence protein CoiA [Turicibacter sp.]|nr:competence protein CoiA [Turicibacter sp.]